MKASVLIADDDSRIRRALETRIQHWGHNVWLASDGEEAVDAAAKRAFDLIVMDLIGSTPAKHCISLICRAFEAQ